MTEAYSEINKHPLSPEAGPILLLGTGEHRVPDHTYLYNTLKKRYDIEIITLSQSEERNLRQSLKKFNTEHFSRVILDIPFKRLHKAAAQLRHWSGVVIFEEDACQNFLPDSKWYQAFSRFYKKLPHARIAVTGNWVASRLQQESIQAYFIPKAFNELTLTPSEQPRDIPAGFVGRVKSRVYQQRAELLNQLAESHGVQLLRTTSAKEYRDTLSRIGVFVSADMGFGEYMAKNFEAMACGCALLACRQGKGEEEALGLIDGENVLLYDTPADAANKLEKLLKDDALREHLSHNGQKLAWERFTTSHLADNLYKLTSMPALPPPKPFSLIEKIRQHFRSL